MSWRPTEDGLVQFSFEVPAIRLLDRAGTWWPHREGKIGRYVRMTQRSKYVRPDALETRAWYDAVRTFADLAGVMPRIPFDGSACQVLVTPHYQHARGADPDNVAKGIADALNRRLWDDDARLSTACGHPVHGTRLPHVEVVVWVPAQYLERRYRCALCGAPPVRWQAQPAGGPAYAGDWEPRGPKRYTPSFRGWWTCEAHEQERRAVA